MDKNILNQINSDSLAEAILSGASVDDIAKQFTKALNTATAKAEKTRLEQERAKREAEEKAKEKKIFESKRLAEAEKVLTFYRTYFPSIYPADITPKEFLHGIELSEKTMKMFDSSFWNLI